MTTTHFKDSKTFWWNFLILQNSKQFHQLRCLKPSLAPKTCHPNKKMAAKIIQLDQQTNFWHEFHQPGWHTMYLGGITTSTVTFFHWYCGGHPKLYPCGVRHSDSPSIYPDYHMIHTTGGFSSCSAHTYSWKVLICEPNKNWLIELFWGIILPCLFRMITIQYGNSDNSEWPISIMGCNRDVFRIPLDFRSMSYCSKTFWVRNPPTEVMLYWFD